jgi:hypothetical protein
MTLKMYTPLGKGLKSTLSRGLSINLLRITFESDSDGIDFHTVKLDGTNHIGIVPVHISFYLVIKQRIPIVFL